MCPTCCPAFVFAKCASLLLVLNSRSALAKESVQSLWSVPSLHALCLSIWSFVDAPLAEYSACVVCVVTLRYATVWCERVLAELDGLVDVIKDGSRDADRVGRLAVVVSPKGVATEAWSGCSMVGASLWVAKWFVKALARSLIGEVEVPPSLVRSFVAGNTGANYGEDGALPPSVPGSTPYASGMRPPPYRVVWRRFLCRHTTSLDLSRLNRRWH